MGHMGRMGHMRTYGTSTLKTARKWETCAHKIASAEEQLHFLHSCKRLNMLPNSVNYKPPIKSQLAIKTVTENGKRMLNTLITETHNRKRNYQIQLDAHKKTMAKCVTEHEIESLNETISRTTAEYKNERHTDLKRKLKNSRHYRQTHKSEESNWVKNLSSRELTEEEKSVLAKGLNYNTKDATQLDFIADLEHALKTNNIEEHTMNNIRHEVTTHLYHHKKPTDLPKTERQTLKTLRNDPKIIILPADKGRTTVVMDKTDYSNETRKLLQDEKTYKKLNKNPTKTTITRINKKLKSLKDEQKLDDKTYHKVRPSDATTARFYGLPKIHKSNTPLRPIVSLPGSPTYELSKYLGSILQPLIKTSTHSVSNAVTFLQHIKNLKIEPDETIVSFDVVSLFTSIPLSTAKRITEELLTTNTSWTGKTNLNKSDLLDLLDLCLSTEFQFEGEFYRQTSGTPMGSPLSSFLAEAVMQDLERQSVESDKDIKLWDRYVDDVLSIAKTHHIENLLKTINSTTDGITFTMEKEKEGKIAFLDIELTRTDDGSIETQVHRKNTHTDQILSYNSNHNTQHKASCLKTLLNRIETHCSTAEAKKRELNHLHKIFRNNNYPNHFINSVHKRWRNRREEQPGNQTNNPTLHQQNL